jgi:predicted GNAT family acetyltransferase
MEASPEQVGPMRAAATELVHDVEQRRYLLKVDGRIASALDYADDGSVVSMTRAFTNPPFRRQGLAAVLVEHAVDDVASRGRRIVPMCWYVAEWFEAHPERAALLA